MFTKIFSAALIATALVSCGNHTQEPAAAPAAATQMPAKTDSIAVTKSPDLSNVVLGIDKDLVCGMPTKGHTEDTASYKGKVYGFCSKECKDEFMKNPATYLAQK